MKRMEPIFKRLSEKGYKHYTENTIEELDELPLNSPDIITEFAHLCEWLRVHYDIWIDVGYEPMKVQWWSLISRIGTSNIEQPEFHGLHSPQEAYSTSIDYVLNKLI